MNEISVIAGDDIVLAVDFCLDNGDNFDFSGKTTAEMILHFGNSEEVFKPILYENNTAKFYLSGDDTKRLLEVNRCGVFHMCIRIIFSNESQNTPIYRKPFYIARC